MTSFPELEASPSHRHPEDMAVHEWRAQQLRRLGLPPAHAALFADRVDWHAIAELVARGCAPALALRIVG